MVKRTKSYRRASVMSNVKRQMINVRSSHLSPACHAYGR